ncbi:MAG TPA: hypothetical protein VLS48_01770 [Anaerolineales bacterium]|nr:hypothetical protein [Anaerolineales bacterium]
MNRKAFGFRKAVLTGILVCTALLLGARTAYAQGIILGDEVPAGAVIDNDLVLTGQDVRIDGVVNGDVLAIGNTVTVSGEINGSLVVIAQRVEIAGRVENSVYAAAVGLTLDGEGATGRNLVYLGMELEAVAGSSIGRDLYALTVGARMNAELGRSAQAIIGPINIFNALIGLFETPLEPYLPGAQEAAPTAGQAPVYGLALAAPAGGYSTLEWMEMLGVIYPAPTAQVVDPQPEPQTAADRNLSFVLDLLRQYWTLVGVGGLILWTAPRFFLRGVLAAQARPLNAALTGLVIFVTGLFAFLLLAGLIMALGFFLNALTLARLATAVWGLGFTGWSFGLVVFLLLTAYLTKAVFAFWAAQTALTRLAPQWAETRLAPLLLGVLVYVLLRAIPFLGWIIGVLATIIGLGAMWIGMRGERVGFVRPAGVEA